MDNVNHAAKILEQAEASLRKLVSEAVTTGDYEEVVKIASWARTLSDMAKAASGEANGAVPQSTLGRKGLRSGKQNPYPRFFRQGDQLIRVAWSKREKKEYQHKTSRSALDALAAAMAEIGKDGRIFPTDQFFPIHDPTDDSEVPSYQAYVGLALLKQMGLIDQHGRKGYSILKLSEFKDAIASLWQTLPEL